MGALPCLANSCLESAYIRLSEVGRSDSHAAEQRRRTSGARAEQIISSAAAVWPRNPGCSDGSLQRDAATPAAPQQHEGERQFSLNGISGLLHCMDEAAPAQVTAVEAALHDQRNRKQGGMFSVITCSPRRLCTEWAFRNCLSFIKRQAEPSPRRATPS